MVFKGKLTLEFREGRIEINEGETYVVLKVVEHCSLAELVTHFPMIEPCSTVHTSSLTSEATMTFENH